MTTPRHTTDSTRRPTGGTIFVVGGGSVGHEVADRLSAEGESVRRVTTKPPRDSPPGQRVHVADTLDAEALDAADLDDADAVVVLGPDDAQNFLVAQLARTRFDADRVLARVNDPECESLFEQLDVEVVDTTQAIAHTAVELW